MIDYENLLSRDHDYARQGIWGGLSTGEVLTPERRKRKSIPRKLIRVAGVLAAVATACGGGGKDSSSVQWQGWDATGPYKRGVNGPFCQGAGGIAVIEMLYNDGKLDQREMITFTAANGYTGTLTYPMAELGTEKIASGPIDCP